jgi:hypothetical protein
MRRREERGKEGPGDERVEIRRGEERGKVEIRRREERGEKIQRWNKN